jgi:hypothetical protein
MGLNVLDTIPRYWEVSEGTLERWRSEGIGPIFLKLQGQVRYRIEDISAYELRNFEPADVDVTLLLNFSRSLICL